MNNTTEIRHRARTARAGFFSLVYTAVGLLLSAALPAQVPAAVEPVADIREAARSYVQNLLKDSGVNTVTAGLLDQRLRLAHCGEPLATALPPGAGVQARVTVAVSCGSPRWSIFVPVMVESSVPVLVLRHAVDRGARLVADDVTLDSRKLAGPGTAYLSAPAELGGRVVRRPLAAGSALTADMFMAETLVHLGQDVTLLAGDGPIEVRASGRAMMDGAAGARIQVQNLSSNRVVEGVVESAEVVRVGL